jgi:hypothetical protein
MSHQLAPAGRGIAKIAIKLPNKMIATENMSTIRNAFEYKYNARACTPVQTNIQILRR